MTYPKSFGIRRTVQPKCSKFLFFGSCCLGAGDGGEIGFVDDGSRQNVHGDEIVSSI